MCVSLNATAASWFQQWVRSRAWESHGVAGTDRRMRFTYARLSRCRKEIEWRGEEGFLCSGTQRGDDHLSQGCDLFPIAAMRLSDHGGHNSLHILSQRDDTAALYTWTFKHTSACKRITYGDLCKIAFTCARMYPSEGCPARPLFQIEEEGLATLKFKYMQAAMRRHQWRSPNEIDRGVFKCVHYLRSSYSNNRNPDHRKFIIMVRRNVARHQRILWENRCFFFSL